jgi:hypothetical protein
MTRLVLCGVALLALVFAGACAQVLGIGNPETCTDGTEYCSVETADGTDGQCFDLQVDPGNCGSCGNSCLGASCVGGSCVDSDCNRELATCVAPASASADCHGLDCVEFAAYTAPVCLRRCRSNDECPYDMFCAPRGDTSYTDAKYSLAAGHCVMSFCGGLAGTASAWYANGIANGGCRVGGDGYVRDGAVTTTAGTCVVVKSGSVGLCFEAGNVQRAGTCTLNSAGCVQRGAYQACGEGDVCLGQTTSATGTCYQVCDPKQTGQCPSGLTCRDKSTDASKSVGACEY